MEKEERLSPQRLPLPYIPIIRKGGEAQPSPHKRHTLQSDDAEVVHNAAAAQAHERAGASHTFTGGVEMVMVVQPSPPARGREVRAVLDEQAGVHGAGHLVHVVDIAGVHTGGVGQATFE